MGHITAPTNPYGEALRQKRVHDYAVLDTPREAVFDRLVFTAAQMFRVPIALLSLADSDRFWFKATVGLDLSEVDRRMSFCEHMNAEDGVLVVEDARLDARFAKVPLVTNAPYVRFYAAAPLITPDGILVGNLSVIDRVPKTMLLRQSWQLSQLARSIVTTLEARR